jgi:subtilisin family serine protease
LITLNSCNNRITNVFSARKTTHNKRKRLCFSLKINRTNQQMKATYFRSFVALFLMSTLGAMAARADSRYIVRVKTGLPIIQVVCQLLGCNVAETIDGSLGQVYLVKTSSSLPPVLFLGTLLGQPGVVGAELDLVASVAGSSYSIPPALLDSTPVNYFGTTVPNGYLNQPATQIIRLADAQTLYGIKGKGTVAVIDTGVDATHPALANVLVPGYDFTRNQDGEGDETGDAVFPQPPAADPSQSSWVNGNTMALVTQSTAAVVDGQPQYTDFGHGTMVAGVVHLVAPGAMIMPLKSFGPDGTGYTSDIIRAIYWAVQHHADIINMSFNLAAYSREVANAINFANLAGVVCVAAAGNSGQQVLTYPAALPNVMGVASTSNSDTRSAFSNYGRNLVWVAAPGEGVVTTYPFGTYAAAWGTSFSTPFVSGVVALMLDTGGSLLPPLRILENESSSSKAMSHAQAIDSTLGNGRLDAYQALTAWRQMMFLF